VKVLGGKERSGREALLRASPRCSLFPVSLRQGNNDHARCRVLAHALSPPRPEDQGGLRARGWTSTRGRERYLNRTNQNRGVSALRQDRTVFKEMSITENANHEGYHGSLRSSSL